MFTRYRLAILVSSLAVGGALLACPNPQERFDEFVDRVPDAGGNNQDGGCANPIVPGDVNGHFLFGLQDSAFGAFVFRFLADVTFTPVAEGGTLNITLTPLNAMTGELIPGAATIPLSAAVVGRCADFTSTKAMLFIPREASVSAEATLGNVRIEGFIRGADLLCGRVSGTVISPTGIPNLEDGDGTTFGSTRIAPGTIGGALPAAITRCPAQTNDAGL